MKCPFRATTTIHKPEIARTIVSKDFPECLGKECPYYYERNKTNKCTGYTVTSYKCRRADNDPNRP